jgi:hypothetical protein
MKSTFPLNDMTENDVNTKAELLKILKAYCMASDDAEVSRHRPAIEKSISSPHSSHSKSLYANKKPINLPQQQTI